jgi:hypothetical protein
VLPNDVTQEDLNSYIAAANTAISPFDLEIRTTLHQTSRTRTYSLVNTTSDPLTQLATTYTADEIAFLKRILDAMFETHNTQRDEVMAVTSFQALQLAKGDGRRETQNGSTQSSRQGLTMMEAEKTLKSFVDEGWFEKSGKGFYTLSPRALMELRGWLVSTYNDPDDEEDEERVDKIKTCHACKDIITMVRPARPYERDYAERYRVNGVHNDNAIAGYTTSAPRTSFAHNSRISVPCARQNGLARTMWGRRWSPRVINICREGGGAAVAAAEIQSKRMAPRMKVEVMRKNSSVQFRELEDDRDMT